MKGQPAGSGPDAGAFSVRGAPAAAALLAMGTLFHDRIRLAISVVALAFAVVLMLLLRGIMDGTVAKSTTYIDHVGASVFVAPAGVENMSLSAAAMDDEAVSTIRSVSGVQSTAGIIRAQIITSSGASRHAAVLIGYDPAASLGGPWKLASGRGVEAPGEVVLDSVLAGDLGVHAGATIAIAGRSFQVVGLSAQTSAIAGKIVFMQLDAARALLNANGLVSFVLVQTSPSWSSADVAASISTAFPSMTALTRAELSTNDRKLLTSLFVQPIDVMSTVGLFVGLGIAGLTMYMTTAERLRDFGVLKAIGASGGFLLGAVLVQAAVLGSLGFVTGLAATRLLAPVVTHFVPDIGVTLQSQSIGLAAASVAAMVLAGAAAPVIYVARVDPLVVFKRS